MSTPSTGGEQPPSAQPPKWAGTFEINESPAGQPPRQQNTEQGNPATAEATAYERRSLRIQRGIWIVTAIYALFAGLQWRVTERTVALMEREAELSQQPVVVLEDILPPPGLTEGEWLPFVAVLRNAGAGLATSVDVSITYAMCDPGERGAPAPTPTMLPRDPTNPGLQLAFVKIRQGADEGQVHIPAMDGRTSREHPFSLFPLDSAALGAIKEREQAVCIYAEIAYSDLAGHRLGPNSFCMAYRMTPYGHQRFSACDVH